MADARFYPSIPPKRLKTDILSTDVSFKLRDILWFTGSDGVDVNLTAVSFGTATVVAGVFEPGTARQEFFSFNPATITLATTTGVTIVGRGLPWSSDYSTQDSTRKFNHASGSVVLLYTNAPAFYDTFLNKNNDETATGAFTWTGINTFAETAMPRISAAHTYIAGEEEFLATKRYADSLTFAGAPNASTTQKGVVEEATDAENNAGTDTGATGARLFSVPSAIAKNAQNQQFQFQGTDTGLANAYIIAITPAPSGGLAMGQRFVFTAANTNTGASTLQINVLLAKDIRKYAAGALSALEAGDIQANQIIDVEYTGGLFLMQQPGGRTPTTAISNEMSTFFGSTDITGAEAETLTLGATSNADTLHTHNNQWNSLSMFLHEDQANAFSAVASGFSDATTKLFTAGMYSTGANNIRLADWEISNDFGSALFLRTYTNDANVDLVSGCLFIGTDFWTIDNNATAADRVEKNGVNETISGTAPTSGGALAHDPTNSFLLIMDTTTRIRRYSGIAGATITFVDSVTLDTAVTLGTGFLYDNTNSRYICLDTTNNVIRRFNSSGTTIDTLAYTVADTTLKGLAMIKDRVYLVMLQNQNPGGGANIDGLSIDLIPTSMTR